MDGHDRRPVSPGLSQYIAQLHQHAMAFASELELPDSLPFNVLMDSNDSNVPRPGFSFPARHRWPDLNRKTH
jgi:hypothetical protein